MLTYIDYFLKTQLALDSNTDLQIQRAHRSLGLKTKPSQDQSWFFSKDMTIKTSYSKQPGLRRLFVRENFLRLHTTFLPK